MGHPVRAAMLHPARLDGRDFPERYRVPSTGTYLGGQVVRETRVVQVGSYPNARVSSIAPTKGSPVRFRSRRLYRSPESRRSNYDVRHHRFGRGQ